MDVLMQLFFTLHDFKNFNFFKTTDSQNCIFSDFIDLWEAIGARKGVGRRTR